MSRAAPTPSRRDALLSGYRPAGGMPDELLAPGGGVRPVWAELLTALADRPPPTWRGAVARGEQYLRDAGVLPPAMPPNDSSERDWPLSHLPVLIGEGEWARSRRGWSSAPMCWRRCAPTSTATTSLSPTGTFRLGSSRDNQEWLRPLVGRGRGAGTSCTSSPSRSGAARGAAGGCLATGRRRHPVRASRSRTGLRPTRVFPMSSPASMSTASRRFFRAVPRCAAGPH